MSAPLDVPPAASAAGMAPARHPRTTAGAALLVATLASAPSAAVETGHMPLTAKEMSRRVPLQRVELAPAPFTDPDVVRRAYAIYEQAGQTPIVLKREAPGFVLNRLQAVLLAEAFRIVGAGVCSPQDLDKTIKDGLGLRWSFMGPFETIELNAPGGIPDYCARYGASLDRMASDVISPDPFGADTVGRIMADWGGAKSAEQVAALSRWRDSRLAQLKAHKRAATRKPDQE